MYGVSAVAIGALYWVFTRTLYGKSLKGLTWNISATATQETPYSYSVSFLSVNRIMSYQ